MHQASKADPAEYNTPTPRSWSRSWQSDPPGGALSPQWEELIASFRSRAPLGSKAPGFTGELLGGGQFRLSDHRNNKSVLIVFGCIACPPCVTNINTTQPNLNTLYAKYRERVEFCYVYTREAHPGKKVGPHASLEHKRANAAELKRVENVTFPLVIDSFDGAIQQSYVDPQFNNPVFLVNRAGIVVYKSAWLDSSELPQVLDDVVLWDERSPVDTTIKKTYSERIRPLREPFDLDANARIKRLMDYIGLEQRAMGPIPGVEAERAGTAEGKSK